jgi:hypothetical protein
MRLVPVLGKDLLDTLLGPETLARKLGKGFERGWLGLLAAVVTLAQFLDTAIVLAHRLPHRGGLLEHLLSEGEFFAELVVGLLSDVAVGEGRRYVCPAVAFCPLLSVISFPLDRLIVLTEPLTDGAREVSFVDPQEGCQEVVIAGLADGFAHRLPQLLVLEARRGDGCVLVEDHPQKTT